VNTNGTLEVVELAGIEVALEVATALDAGIESLLRKVLRELDKTRRSTKLTSS
jgi:hypothetical protein